LYGKSRPCLHGAWALNTSTKFRDDSPNRCREIRKIPLPQFWVLDFVVIFAGRRGLTWGVCAPSRVNRWNPYIYRKTIPTGPPQFGAGKSIRPLDDYLRRTVTPREGSESLRFLNRTLPSVNGNSRTDGTSQNAHWRPFVTGIRVRISRKHRNNEFRSNCSVSQNSCTIFEILRTKIFRGESEMVGVIYFWGHPMFLGRPTSWGNQIWRARREHRYPQHVLTRRSHAVQFGLSGASNFEKHIWGFWKSLIALRVICVKHRDFAGPYSRNMWKFEQDRFKGSGVTGVWSFS
jgi:hypothetical protein